MPKSGKNDEQFANRILKIDPNLKGIYPENYDKSLLEKYKKINEKGKNIEAI